ASSFRYDEKMPSELRDGEKTNAKFSDKLAATFTAAGVRCGRDSKFLTFLTSFCTTTDVLYQLRQDFRTKPTSIVTHRYLSKTRRVSQDHHLRCIRVIGIRDKFPQCGRRLTINTLSDPGQNQFVCLKFSLNRCAGPLGCSNAPRKGFVVLFRH